MQTINFKSYIKAGFLSLIILISLGSCTASRPQSAWMDVGDARSLDHLKGNKTKKINKKYHRRHR